MRKLYTRIRPGSFLVGLTLWALGLLWAGAGLAGDRLLVVNKSDDTVSVLEVATGKVIATVATGAGPHEVAISPDGKRAAVSNYGTGSREGRSLTLFNPAHPGQTTDIHLADGRRPHGLAWLPDGRHLLVTSEVSASLLLVDADSGRTVAAIPTRQALSHMVAVDPLRQRAYVANIESGSLSVIDLATRDLIRVVPTGPGAEGVAVAPGSGDVWVTNRDEHTVVILDPEGLEVKQRIHAGEMPIRIAFTPDGSKAVVSNGLGASATIYQVQPPKRIADIDLSEHYRMATGVWFGGLFGTRVFPIGLTLNGDGTRAYVANTYGGLVVEIDLDAQSVSRTLIAGTEPDGLAYWPRSRIFRLRQAPKDSEP